MHEEAELSVTDRLLAYNRAHADLRRGAGGSPRPAMKIALLACMDTRLNPYAILGLREGDAHLIRNAGGVVTEDAVRSLAISQHLLGTEEVMVLQHTDCGLLTISDEEFASRMEREAGQRPNWSAHAFSDLDQSVRGSVRRLRESPFLRQRSVRGFVYDVETGRVREVNSP
jgi:carbonic anhydrase